MMIAAPLAVVELWRKEAARLVETRQTLTDRGGDPQTLAALDRAVSVLLGSAMLATPGATAQFAAGLDRLAQEVTAAQDDTGPAAPCPAPGESFVCTCGPDGRALCRLLVEDPSLDVDLDRVAADDRARRPHAGDDGCEGGVA
jgi:hypothetical protein